MSPDCCAAAPAPRANRPADLRWPLLACLGGVLLGAALGTEAATRKVAAPAAPAASAPASAAAPATSMTAAGAKPAKSAKPAEAPGDAARLAASDADALLPSLTRQPVRLVSTGRPLAELQRQIEPALGVRLILGAGAAEQSVSGEFRGVDGLAFVRDLAAKQRLDWALGREGVYLAPEGSARAVVFNAPTATIAMRAAALANQEFESLGSAIRVVARKDEITVTAIPAWINQVAAQRIPTLVDFVQRTMAQMASAKADAARGAAGTDSGLSALEAGAVPAGEQLKLMVFKLNNAYVDDKRLSVGSSTMLIPGVATLFRQFTGIGGGSGSSELQVQTDPSASRLDRMEPLAGGRSPRVAAERDEGAGRPLGRDSARGRGEQGANQPAVIADSRMNALIVRDRQVLLDSYKALIQLLDQPADMVQLDAFVIDIKASKVGEFGLGLSWSGSGRVNSPGFAPGGSIPSGANVILQAVRGAQLLAQIRLLESTGDSEILTVPSVVTLNNLEATFSSRQNFYVKVSGNQDASLTKVTAETLLRVTPLVSNAVGASGAERRIRLLISIQDGSIDASASAAVDNLPRTQENQISTQAVVRGGDTLVIGGQVVRKRINNLAGLPIIKDLPLLGTLTNSRVDEYDQYVRIYVVRPRLLGDDSSLLNAPVPAEQADPLVNGAIDRVPELIRGSGLSPRGPDLRGGPAPAAPAAEPLVVPMPLPLLPPPPPPPAAPEPGSGNTDKTDGKAAKAAGDADLAAAWNPADPVWRAPGSPAGRPLALLTPPPAPASTRVEAATQWGRDREARRILEVELQRAELAQAKLEREALSDPAGLRVALALARDDTDALRRELARLKPQGPATSAAR